MVKIEVVVAVVVVVEIQTLMALVNLLH